jgi:catechol 2,3-dioxygenase-like lactoylglutathione lyase family enzyme
MPVAYGGRLLDHMHLRVADLDASKRFYRAALESVGLGFTEEGDGWFAADELYISAEEPRTTGLHLALQAADEDAVARFHAAAIAAGGTDNGPPGERSYHPGYYAAFVLDPDGNNIEAVYHGPHTRSAAAIVYEW